MSRSLLMMGALFGALGVGLGAFGAHGLQAFLNGAIDANQRQQWWSTASEYHLLHAVVLTLCAAFAQGGFLRWSRRAASLFAFGIVVFSGTLYAMALGAPRWLGAVTPIGGVALILGWLVLALGAARRATP